LEEKSDRNERTVKKKIKVGKKREKVYRHMMKKQRQ
jgi:hypothetical protein